MNFKTNSLYRYMKKIALVFLFSLVLATTVGGVALAQPIDPTTTLPPATISTTGELEALVATIINWIFFIFVSIALVMIILAGLQFVTGGGDPAAVSQARMKLIWAGAGIAIALTARGFEPFIRNLIGA